MLSLVPLYVSATGSLRTRCFADGYWSSLCTRDGQPPDGGGSDAFHYALGECVAPSSITRGAPDRRCRGLWTFVLDISTLDFRAPRLDAVEATRYRVLDAVDAAA